MQLIMNGNSFGNFYTTHLIKYAKDLVKEFSVGFEDCRHQVSIDDKLYDDIDLDELFIPEEIIPQIVNFNCYINNIEENYRIIHRRFVESVFDTISSWDRLRDKVYELVDNIVDKRERVINTIFGKSKYRLKLRHSKARGKKALQKQMLRFGDNLIDQYVQYIEDETLYIYTYDDVDVLKAWLSEFSNYEHLSVKELYLWFHETIMYGLIDTLDTIDDFKVVKAAKDFQYDTYNDINLFFNI